MKVSIVTPVYNGEKYIKRMYDILNNALSVDIDWIIVDDCSTDGTHVILKQIENIDQISVIYLDDNSGPSVARRSGAEYSVKEYIFFLDVDDIVDLERFHEFLDFCSTNESYNFFYAPLKLTSTFENLNFGDNNYKVEELCHPAMYISKGFPQPSSLLVNKNFYLNYDVANNLRWGEDFIMYLCLAKYGKGLKWDKEVSFYYVDGTGRGSKLSWVLRAKLTILLAKISLKREKVFSSMVYTTYLTIRHIASYIYKKIKF